MYEEEWDEDKAVTTLDEDMDVEKEDVVENKASVVVPGKYKQTKSEQ